MDARRAQLLELGLRLFAHRPYEEVSIEDIAAEAGVSKGLLYHYFGSKRQLYVAVVDLAARRLLESIVPGDNVPLQQRPLAGLDAYLSFVQTHRESFSALMNGGLGADPQISAIVDHAREAIIGRIMLELGLREPRPTFRMALRGFIGAAEAASIEWLRHGADNRYPVLMVLLSSLYAAVMTAAILDPEAGVQPEPPDPLLPLARVLR